MRTPAKPPSDHTRLACAFKVPPTKRGAAVTVTSAFAAIGALGVTVAFVPAVGLLVGLGGFEVFDRRAIAKGLRELDDWGFPITGYREWLLADEPAFDVELQRHVDIQVLTTSASAIDPAIRIRRIDERKFRVITRRIALPGRKDGAPPIYLGDRRLLRELYDRILSPLHADVGVVGLRMGDNSALPAITAGIHRDDNAAPLVEGMGAFRDQAMAAPPALQALVHGGSSLALAEDTRKLRFRSERILYAAGRHPAGVGTVLAITLGGVFTGVQLGPIGAGIGAIGGFIGGIVAAVGTNRRNSRAVGNLVGWQGFAIEDYDAWLLSGRPMFDLELATPVDQGWLAQQLRTIQAFSGEESTMVRWVEDVMWLDERTARVETRPTLNHVSSSKIQPFYGGSHLLFQRLVLEVLVPLHKQVGIRVVRMGGFIDRRV